MSELKFRGTDRDKLKLRFLKPEGEISRRELFKLALPRYEAVPFVEPALCRGNRECGLCLDACPLEAIRVEDDRVIIDTALCTGCGACLAACPHRAVLHPTFSPEQLDGEMGGLLTSAETPFEPKVIALTCQSCLPASTEGTVNHFSYPPSMLPLKIPCLAMASPWLLLRALDRGARGVALISSQRKCPVGFNSASWQEDVRFVQGLLRCWGIEPERIREFDVADGSAGVARALAGFTREIAALAPTGLKIAEPTPVPDTGLLLPALVSRLGAKLGRAAGGTVSQGRVPLAKVELDYSQCTGCGLCLGECPTGALNSTSGEESYRLLFRHDLCVACGRCIGVCPEQCLGLERILELDKIDGTETVLFEDGIARCRQCGDVIGSRAMIEKLQAKISASIKSPDTQLELCAACKAKQFSLGRAILRSADKPAKDRGNGYIP